MISGSDELVKSSEFVTSATNPLEVPDWNLQISQLGGSTIFHTREWCKVLRDTYGFNPYYITRRRGGQVCALLPVLEANSWLAGRRGVSLSFTDYCAPIATASDDRRPLIDAALACGRERNWKYFECRGAELGAWCPAAEASIEFFTHELDLAPGVEALFQQCDSSTRRAVRKAQKSNITLNCSIELAAMEEYFRLHCQTRREHGLPPQPWEFFLNIHREILSQNHGMIVSASCQGRAVAALVLFFFENQALYKFGASDSQFQHLRPNNLVMWEAIRQSIARGMERFHFGRTSLHNEGLRRFKLGWGSREARLSYYKYDLMANRFRKDKDATSGWHTSVFRALPVQVSRILGRLLYRHMA